MGKSQLQFNYRPVPVREDDGSKEDSNEMFTDVDRVTDVNETITRFRKDYVPLLMLLDTKYIDERVVLLIPRGSKYDNESQ